MLTDEECLRLIVTKVKPCRVRQPRARIARPSQAALIAVPRPIFFATARRLVFVIAGVPDAEDTRTLLRLVWQRYIPNRVLLLADGAVGQRQLAHWVPSLASVKPKQ